jgi:hypothetical protein
VEITKKQLEVAFTAVLGSVVRSNPADVADELWQALSACQPPEPETVKRYCLWRVDMIGNWVPDMIAHDFNDGWRRVKARRMAGTKVLMTVVEEVIVP